MSRPLPTGNVVRFGPFEFHPASQSLWRDGNPVPLPPLPSSVLSHLLEHPGRIVTRAELREACWGGHRVGFDDRLNTCVRALRTALDDDARSPGYIVTQRGRGYRFVGDVTAAAWDSARDRHARSAPRTLGSRRWRTAAVIAGAFLVGVTARGTLTDADANEGLRSGAGLRAVADPLVDPGTVVPEAWTAYVRATVLLQGEGEGSLREADRLLTRAIQLDPTFANARAYLAGTRAERGWRERDPALIAEAGTAARAAIERTPHSGEAWLALGRSQHFDRRFDEALYSLETARDLLPGEPRVHLALGGAYRRLGRWLESNRAFGRVLELDPFSVPATWALALNHERLRDFDRADALYRKAIALDPEHLPAYLRRALMHARLGGDPNGARAILEEAARAGHGSPTELALSIRELARMLGPSSDWEGIDANSGSTIVRLGRAWLLASSGRADEARTEYARLVEELAPRAHGPGAWDGVPTVQGILGLAYAGAGDVRRARRQANRILEEFPAQGDALTASYLRVIAAEIFTSIGDFERAAALVAEQLARPSTLTVKGLRSDPVWAPLREYLAAPAEGRLAETMARVGP
ncbi:MAG: winged helix-turn-helix domain-containing protein [Gemmatimonadota bacterium]